MPCYSPTSEAPSGFRVLFPEVTPEDQFKLDPESAIMAEERARVFRAYVKFKSVRKTAEALAEASKESGIRPIHFTTVGRYVKEVVENYRLIQLQDAATNAALMLSKYVTLETELWEMLEKSKGEVIETSTTRRSNQSGTNDTASVKKKQLIGSVAIASEIRACLNEQAKLLGLIDRQTNGKGMEGIPATKLIAGIDPVEQV